MNEPLPQMNSLNLKTGQQKGVMLRYNGTAWEAIPKGTAAQLMTFGSDGLPAWAAAPVDDSPAVAGGFLSETYVVKSADESVTNNTMQDDDHLVKAIAANEIWLIEARVIVQSASGTPDFKFGFTAPASPTYASMDFVVSDASGTFSSGSGGVGGAPSVAITADVPSILSIRFYIANGTNAGSFTFRWAQNTTNATATKVLKGSCLRCLRIA